MIYEILAMVGNSTAIDHCHVQSWRVRYSNIKIYVNTNLLQSCTLSLSLAVATRASAYRVKSVGHHDAHAPCVESGDQRGLGVAAVLPDPVQIGQRHPPEPLHYQHSLRAELLVHLCLRRRRRQQQFWHTKKQPKKNRLCTHKKTHR